MDWIERPDYRQPRRWKALSVTLIATLSLLVLSCREEPPTDLPQLPSTATPDRSPTLVSAPTPIPNPTSLPSPPKPADDTTLPIYVQIVQTILMPGAALKETSSDLPWNNVFVFDPTGRTLFLRPDVSLSLDAQVVVGLTTVIQEANQNQVRGELYQIPPNDTGPLKLVAIGTEGEALTVNYASQTFELQPGASRSFKQPVGNAVQITVVTHHGRLTSVEPLASIPGGR